MVEEEILSARSRFAALSSPPFFPRGCMDVWIATSALIAIIAPPSVVIVSPGSRMTRAVALPGRQ
jgi:hypothetical protein